MFVNNEKIIVKTENKIYNKPYNNYEMMFILDRQRTEDRYAGIIGHKRYGHECGAGNYCSIGNRNGNYQ